MSMLRMNPDAFSSVLGRGSYTRGCPFLFLQEKLIRKSLLHHSNSRIYEKGERGGRTCEGVGKRRAQNKLYSLFAKRMLCLGGGDLPGMILFFAFVSQFFSPR